MESNDVTTVLKAHVALRVRNLNASIEFYRRMLGIEPLKVRQGYAKFDVQNPPLNLSLNADEHKGTGALSHLGLQVANTDDVIAIRRRWAAAGLKPRDEMQTSCCYALQDKTWVQDPDGNEWEAFTVIADVATSNHTCCQTAANDGTSSCCQTQETGLVNIGM